MNGTFAIRIKVSIFAGGVEVGRMEEKRTIARTMGQLGMAIGLIAEFAGLPVDEIKDKE